MNIVCSDHCDTFQLWPCSGTETTSLMPLFYAIFMMSWFRIKALSAGSWKWPQCTIGSNFNSYIDYTAYLRLGSSYTRRTTQI